MTFNIGKVGRIDFFDEQFECLGSGSEAKVYRYSEDIALKIYLQRQNSSSLTEDRAVELSKIDTDRVVLPNEIIYDEFGQMIGYTEDFVKDYNHAFRAIKGSTLVEEINLIEKDASTLADNNYIVNDLHRDNMLYDSKLYLIDPGKYRKVPNDNEESIIPAIYNQEEINNFLIAEIIGGDLEKITSMKKTGEMISEIYKQEIDEIKEELYESKTLRSYTRSLVKKY